MTQIELQYELHVDTRLPKIRGGVKNLFQSGLELNWTRVGVRDWNSNWTKGL